MLAAAENALIEALRAHRVVQAIKVKTVDSLPKLSSTEELLARYAVDAPAIYVISGRLTGDGDDGYMNFTIVGVVRNVGGNAKARKGDGIDVGCDHLLVAVIRALHGHKVGQSNWSVKHAEMIDDDLFDKPGLAAVEISLESSAIQLLDDWLLPELDDFLRLHADLDIPPQSSGAEHAKWLQTPPDLSTSRPDAEVDVTLEGAS